jgi:predicted secreted acid phosphatase
VFVTNRDKTLDADTWANLQLVGLPIDEKNTCLIGRTSADKDALKDVKYDNDKDLRREQVRQGEAKCFTKSGTIPSSWKAPHSIIMQVGDNIEDINNVTQEDADIDSILPRWGKDIVILPNPMYGSWH